jgi:uncharacterized membrane protein
MNEDRHSPQEKWIALVLRAGAYSSFALLIASAMAGLLKLGAAPTIARIGIMFLLATPLLRILAAIWMYAVTKDKRMVWISAGVLLILVGSSVLGMELR